jgi:hypothetical protein
VSSQEGEIHCKQMAICCTLPPSPDPHPRDGCSLGTCSNPLPIGWNFGGVASQGP